MTRISTTDRGWSPQKLIDDFGREGMVKLEPTVCEGRNLASVRDLEVGRTYMVHSNYCLGRGSIDHHLLFLGEGRSKGKPVYLWYRLLKSFYDRDVIMEDIHNPWNQMRNSRVGADYRISALGQFKLTSDAYARRIDSLDSKMRIDNSVDIIRKRTIALIEANIKTLIGAGYMVAARKWLLLYNSPVVSPLCTMTTDGIEKSYEAPVELDINYYVLKSFGGGVT